MSLRNKRVSLVPFINYNYSLCNAELKIAAKALKPSIIILWMSRIFNKMSYFEL